MVYRRGFVEAMSLTGRSFISLGAGLFDATPLREVRLVAVNFLMDELFLCPHLAKLDVLNLRGNQLDAMRPEIEARVYRSTSKLRVVWGWETT